MCPISCQRAPTVHYPSADLLNVWPKEARRPPWIAIAPPPSSNARCGTAARQRLHCLRNGLQWKDAPKEYGPHKTPYNLLKKGLFPAAVRTKEIATLVQDF